MVTAPDDRDPLFPQFRLGSPEASAARVAAIGQRGFNPARPNADSPVPNWDAGLSAPTGRINASIGASGGPLPPTEQLAVATSPAPREQRGGGVAPPYQDNPFTVTDEPLELTSLDIEMFTPAREDPEPDEMANEPRRRNPFDARSAGFYSVDEGDFEAPEPVLAAPRVAQAPPAERRSSSSGSGPQSRGRMPRMQRASAEFDDVMASIDARLFGGES